MLFKIYRAIAKKFMYCFSIFITGLKKIFNYKISGGEVVYYSFICAIFAGLFGVVDASGNRYSIPFLDGFFWSIGGGISAFIVLSILYIKNVNLGFTSSNEYKYIDSEFYQHNSFICIDGPAKKAARGHSNMKVCFTCRDSDFLKALLFKVAKDEECYWVKMSTKSRDGMYLGRCFFTTKEKAAKLWAQYKTHPRLMVTLQDDEFADAYRELVVSWKDKSENALN